MGEVVFVGTGKGAVALRRNGNGWRHQGLKLQGWLVTAATQGPDGRYYIGVTSDVYGCTIVVTEDFESFAPLENGPRYEEGERGIDMHNRLMGAMDPQGEKSASQRYVDQIWKLHCDGKRLYAGVSEAGLFTSDDLGASWQPVRGLNDHPSRDGWDAGFGGLCCHSILTDAKDPKRLWAGISAAGVFRSDDGGESWIPANEGVSVSEGYCVHGLAHDPDHADVIYRQDHRGFYRTDDGGEFWHLIENGLPIGELSDNHRCVFGFPAVMNVATDAVFAIPLAGDNHRFPKNGDLAVYRTRTKGQNWERLDNGLPSDFYTSILRGAMAVDQGADFGVYFGTSGGQVFISENGGRQWEEVVSGLAKVMCVASFQ